MFACRQGHHQVVETLMESPHTDPNIISPTGSSALHLAAIFSDDCVRILGSDHKQLHFQDRSREFKLCIGKGTFRGDSNKNVCDQYHFSKE